jgi:hypothetical protein
MRTALIVIALAAVVIGWFVYQGFAEYSTSPDSSAAICYTENWSASEYVVLKQGTYTTEVTLPDGTTRPQEGFRFYYDTSAAGTNSSNQQAYDFVPVKWEVTGNVSFKSE